jgi:hypothetical protein
MCSCSSGWRGRWSEGARNRRRRHSGRSLPACATQAGRPARRRRHPRRQRAPVRGRPRRPGGRCRRDGRRGRRAGGSWLAGLRRPRPRGAPEPRLPGRARRPVERRRAQRPPRPADPRLRNRARRPVERRRAHRLPRPAGPRLRNRARRPVGRRRALHPPRLPVRPVRLHAVASRGPRERSSTSVGRRSADRAGRRGSLRRSRRRRWPVPSPGRPGGDRWRNPSAGAGSGCRRGWWRG